MPERKIGRPVGSKSGREPVGGCPSISPEFGAFLAGFIEGEGSFTINKQQRHPSYGCSLRLNARDDDGDLIRDLATQTGLGAIRPISARSTSKAQIVWSIAAKADCLQLTAILNRHPLRGRKSRDYAIWCAAVQWWAGNDPICVQPGRDWTPIKYLKERLQEVKHFSHDERQRVIDDVKPGLWGDWPSYIAGFFTAEGCLGIYKGGNTACVRQPRSVLEPTTARC